MAPTIVLISGANRGLGKGILQRYLAKPNHIVIAANRDPKNPSSKALADLPAGPGSRLVIVKIDASVESDPSEAVKELAAQGIDHVDIVVANAGVAFVFPKVSELKVADLQAHIVPNVFGVVWLYQAMLPLLLKSTNPKWATMGSGAGCLEVSTIAFCATQPPVTNAAYAPSKAAVHWLTKRINVEEGQLTAFVLDPGWVQTEMGNSGALLLGLEEAPVGIDDSCNGVVRVIDGAAKESHGGRLWGYEGKVLPW